jgi:hypothetical protein
VAVLLVFASSYGGLAALALAMSRYERRVWRRTPSNGIRVLLRALGSVGLVLALWGCVAHFDWAMGVVWWTAMMTVASLLLALAITYRPRFVALSGALAWLSTSLALALQ